MAKISELNIYPVKSLHGISLKEATLGIRGFEYDRNWMLTDQNGKFLSQRQIPQMALIHVAISEEELILSNKNHSSLHISLCPREPKPVKVTIWDDTCEAYDEGPDSSKWLTSVLGEWKGQQLQLVRISSTFKRIVEPDVHGGDKVHTAFADRYPYLIAWEESLIELNERLVERDAQQIPMDRFRANITLKGLPCSSANDIRSLQDPTAHFHLNVIKPCKRCKIIAIDQDTAKTNNPPAEPMATLVTMNSTPNKKLSFFGHRAILEKGELYTICVGDNIVATCT